MTKEEILKRVEIDDDAVYWMNPEAAKHIGHSSLPRGYFWSGVVIMKTEGPITDKQIKEYKLRIIK